MEEPTTWRNGHYKVADTRDGDKAASDPIGDEEAGIWGWSVEWVWRKGAAWRNHRGRSKEGII